MEKFELVRSIFNSEKFKTSLEQNNIIEQIIATGEINREDVMTLYYQSIGISKDSIYKLETLPRDVFINIVLKGNIEGKDLIYLCNTSSKLNSYCNYNFVLPDGTVIPQYLFTKLLQKRGIRLEYGDNPREIYKWILMSEDGKAYYRLSNRLQRFVDFTHEIRGDDFAEYPFNIYELLYSNDHSTFSFLHKYPETAEYSLYDLRMYPGEEFPPNLIEDLYPLIVDIIHLLYNLKYKLPSIADQEPYNKNSSEIEEILNKTEINITHYANLIGIDVEKLLKLYAISDVYPWQQETYNMIISELNHPSTLEDFLRKINEIDEYTPNEKFQKVIKSYNNIKSKSIDVPSLIDFIVNINKLYPFITRNYNEFYQDALRKFRNRYVRVYDRNQQANDSPDDNNLKQLMRDWFDHIMDLSQKYDIDERDEDEELTLKRSKELEEIRNITDEEINYLIRLHKKVLDGTLPVLTRFVVNEMRKF